MPVLVSSRLRRRLPLAPIQSRAAAILARAGATRAGLSVVFVGDGAMRRLNRVYRKKDRTTDVLAFPSQKISSRVTSVLLGDVVVSLPQAARQAKRAGHSLDREVTVLLVHGILHLLGYDHERSPREAVRMQRKEHAVLRAIGWGSDE